MMDAQNRYFRKLIADIRPLLREYADPDQWDGNTVRFIRPHPEVFAKALDHLEIKDGTVKLDLMPQTIAEARTSGRAEAYKLLIELTLDQLQGSEFMEAGEIKVRFDEEALKAILQPEARHMSLISGLENAYWEQQTKIHELSETINSCQEDTRRIDALADNRVIGGFEGIRETLDVFAAEERQSHLNGPDDSEQAYRTAYRAALRNLIDAYVEILETERGYVHIPSAAD
jgi:hypothetical protein